MTIEREEIVTAMERSSDLAIESAQSLVDSAYLAQRQALQLNQAVLNTIEANHQATRDLAGKLVRQTLEGQGLWWQFVRESFLTTADFYARATRSALDEANRDLTTASREVQAAEKRTAATAR